MGVATRADATDELRRVFEIYRKAQPTDAGMLALLKDGKLYELYVLSRVVGDLARRGFVLHFVRSASPGGHSTLKFKASAGMIKLTDSHFVVLAPRASSPVGYLFVDVEFDTLGHWINPAGDLSRRHELDIVLTRVASGYPAHDQIALGVECKAVANFGKDILKEVLGVRRELSFTGGRTASLPSTLGGHPPKEVAAQPPSEFTVAFIDPKGLRYQDSPSAFGISFEHMQP